MSRVNSFMKDNNVLLTILKSIGSNLSNVICSICSALSAIFAYKNTSALNKEKERLLKNEEEFDKKVDTVTKSGTLEDLLDLKRK